MIMPDRRHAGSADIARRDPWMMYGRAPNVNGDRGASVLFRRSAQKKAAANPVKGGRRRGQSCPIGPGRCHHGPISAVMVVRGGKTDRPPTRGGYDPIGVVALSRWHRRHDAGAIMRVEARVQLSLGRALVYYTLVGANAILIAHAARMVWPKRHLFIDLGREIFRWCAANWGR
jgi:hypothetical protein